MATICESQFRELHEKLVREGKIQDVPFAFNRPTSVISMCHDCGRDTLTFIDRHDGGRKFIAHIGDKLNWKCVGSGRRALISGDAGVVDNAGCLWFDEEKLTRDLAQEKADA